MTKLFIGGLPYSVNDQSLNEMFSAFGQVLSASVVVDKFTNQSKGFGFVEMADDNAAQEAIKNLEGSSLEGRRLGVSVARPKEDRPRDNSRFNGGGSRNDSRGGGSRGGDYGNSNGGGRDSFKRGRR